MSAQKSKNNIPRKSPEMSGKVFKFFKYHRKSPKITGKVRKILRNVFFDVFKL